MERLIQALQVRSDEERSKGHGAIANAFSDLADELKGKVDAKEAESAKDGATGFPRAPWLDGGGR